MYSLIKISGIAVIISYCLVGSTFSATAQDDTSYDLKEILGLYEIEIPDFMELSTTLNADASLQYNHLEQEKYIIVIDENKQEFVDVFKELGMYDAKKSVIDNYAEQQYKFMSADSDILFESKLTFEEINGLLVRRMEFDANVKGVPEAVSYFFSFVEGEESLYMIMAWTLLTDKKLFVDEVEVMINSFRELDGARNDEYVKAEFPDEEVVGPDEFEMFDRTEQVDKIPQDHIVTRSSDDKSLRIKVNALYEMSVPSFMSSSTTLNDDASLQYNNLYKEKYVIVIDENKQEFVDVFKELGIYDEKLSLIDNYAQQQYKFMSEGSDIKSVSKMKSMKVNGMNARGKNFDADVPGVPQTVSYFFGFVEGKDNLYMIMAWTLESKKDSFKGEAEAMIKSLKEQ